MPPPGCTFFCCSLPKLHCPLWQSCCFPMRWVGRVEAMAIHQCFLEESSRGHWAAALVVQELLLLRKSRTINHLIFAFPSEIHCNQTLSPHVTTVRGVQFKQIPVFTILIILYVNIGVMPVAESEAEQSSRYLGYHLSYKAVFNLTSPSTCFSHDFYALFAMVGGRLLICQ